MAIKKLNEVELTVPCGGSAAAAFIAIHCET
jgi:hypothetical protein